MNLRGILQPLAVVALVVTAALATATPVNAGETLAQTAAAACLQPDEVKALFEVAPLSVSVRDRLAEADRATTLRQAAVAALFDVAPLSFSMRARLVEADATLEKAEVAALFDVAPRKSVPAQPREKPVSP